MLKSLLRHSKRAANALFGEDPFQTAPTVLFRFQSQADVDRWHVFTDANFGGRSVASFELSPSKDAAVFSGRHSTEADEDTDLHRTGYCCASSKVLAIADYLDLEHFSHLAYSVRGDGRTYIANLRVDNMTGSGGDVWQAPFTPAPGAWSVVRIPFDVFAMTQKGQLVERRFPLARSKIISLGIAISADETAGTLLRVAAAGGGEDVASAGRGSGSTAIEADDDASRCSSGCGSPLGSVHPPAAAPEAVAGSFQLEVRDIVAERRASVLEDDDIP